MAPPSTSPAPPVIPAVSEFVFKETACEVMSVVTPDSDPSAPVILFVPGNPGTIGYYRLFFGLLSAQLDGRVDIHGVSHVGHDQRTHDWSVFTLDDQIEHKIEWIEKVLVPRYGGGRDILLMGHSVGQHICFEIMRRRPGLRVRHTFGIFPMIRDFWSCAPTPAKILLQPGARQVFGAAVGLLAALPGGVAERVIRLMPDMDEETRVVTSLHLASYRTFSNVLHMAYTEMREVREWTERDWAFMRSVAPRTTLLYTTKDHWGPERHYEELKEKLEEATVLMEPGIPHAFPLGSAARMADLVGPRLRSLCGLAPTKP
eukprot:tig00000057_g117.t1